MLVAAFVLALTGGLATGCLRRGQDADSGEARPAGDVARAAASSAASPDSAAPRVPGRAKPGDADFAGRSGSATSVTGGGAYKPDAGPFRVAAADFELRAGKREKTLPIKVRWPAGPRATGPAPTTQPAAFPLVVFSHGAGGASDAFPQLSRHWASHGYVVVHPTHSDSIKLRRTRGERLGGGRDAARQVVRGVRPEERVEDVKLVLDAIAQIEARIAARGGPAVHIDRDRIAVAGHSAGALTTQMIAGLRFTGRGRLLLGDRDFSDPRVRAAIVISGQGLGRPALAADSWQRIRIPMMVYAGSADYSPVSDETPAGRRHPFEYAPPGDKYLVYIEGATHGSYQGRLAARAIGERPPANTRYITDVVAFGTLAFLDAYLREDAEARAYLGSDRLTEHPGGRLEFLRK